MAAEDAAVSRGPGAIVAMGGNHLEGEERTLKSLSPNPHRSVLSRLLAANGQKESHDVSQTQGTIESLDMPPKAHSWTHLTNSAATCHTVFTEVLTSQEPCSTLHRLSP